MAQIHGSTRLPLLLLQGLEGDGNVHGRASDDHLGVGGDGAGSVEFREIEGFCVAVTSDEARRRKSSAPELCGNLGAQAANFGMGGEAS